jgi:hypothetical protein
VLILGVWAAIVPFIGPYFDFGLTPRPDETWYWTAGRAYLEVIPGAAAIVGGALLLLSASRLVTILGGLLALFGGGWLVVGSPLADYVGIDRGMPAPTASAGVSALIALFYFFAIGAAIVLVSGFALGRLTVHGLRDVRAAERRAANETLPQRDTGSQRDTPSQPDTESPEPSGSASPAAGTGDTNPAGTGDTNPAGSPGGASPAAGTEEDEGS